MEEQLLQMLGGPCLCFFSSLKVGTVHVGRSGAAPLGGYYET